MKATNRDDNAGAGARDWEPENLELLRRIEQLQQEARDAKIEAPLLKRGPPLTAGHLADNWSLDRAALVVNPDALPVDLLAWCWGEVMSLKAAAVLASVAADSISAEDMTAIFLHRLEPLESMLEHAITQLLVAMRLEAGPNDSGRA